MLSHHAVVYHVEDYATPSGLLPELQSVYEVEVVMAPKLAIAEVRRIIESAHKRPFGTATKVIYIATGHIAHDAQNALLKVLEEPPVTTKFVLWLGRQVELLPTITSRVQVVTDSTAVETPTTFTDLMATPIPDRLATIAAIYKNKDLETDQQLYRGLTKYLTTSSASLSADIQRDIVHLHSQLQGPGASKKMLWEAIALLWPVESTCA